MKKYMNKQVIALVLASVMLLSNIPVVGFAEEQTYCGLDHEHEQACYSAPATEPAEEPTEETTEATTEVTTDPTGVSLEQEKSLYEKLLAAVSLQEMCDLMGNLSGLTEEQLAAVKAHAQALYTDLTAPTATETAQHEQLVSTISTLEELLKAEPDPTGEPDPTEEPNPTEEPEKSLMDKLMAAVTMQELHDLLMADTAKTASLLAGELSAVKTYAKELYQNIAEPTQDDADYYELVISTLEYLLGGFVPEGNPSVLPENGIELTEELAAAPLEDGLYVLTRDINLSEIAYSNGNNVAHIHIPEDKNVEIDLNGFELKGNGTASIIYAGNNTSVTITDSSADHSGGITGGKTENKGGAICTYGTLTITGGNIYGNVANLGGAIYSEGKVIINNGHIHSNTARSAGGAIYATAVEIHGGLIGDRGFQITWEGKEKTTYPTVHEAAYVTNITPSARKNTANNGGAVYVRGTFLMDGGELAGNHSSYRGGAIYCTNSTSFTMSGGLVIGNYAGDNAGGIYFQHTTGTITGGQIRYNRTAKFSGGINVNTHTELTISGLADISYNSCFNNGGALGVEDGGTKTTVCTINGGTLTYNYATNKGNNSGRGGAIRCVTTLIINDGLIAYNKAKTQGGAIHASTDNRTNSTRIADIHLNGGTISNNIAASTGGGVCVESETDEVVTFTMTGSKVVDNHSDSNGGGIYLAAVMGTLVANLEGGSFEGNTAQNGAGLYVDVKDTAVKGTVNISGTTLIGNEASVNGGGLYLTAAGTASVALNVSGGKLESNTAVENGGAAYINAGNFTMTGGTMQANGATNGGGGYVNGGNVTVAGGQILSNTASTNGGGVAVNNGQVVMTSGSVSGNKASSGAGGGIYVSSTGDNNVSVMVYGGTLSGNSAATTGGAVDVLGESGTITVQTGVNDNHKKAGSAGHNFTHVVGGVTYTSTGCPVIQNNTSGSSGGAFHIKGARSTRLNIYCLTDGNNRASGDINPLNEHMSDFMMVEGGTVYLSTSTSETMGEIGGSDQDSPEGDDASGNMTIHDSIHVVGGVLELFGSKNNPALEDGLTIDLRNVEDNFIDHRSSKTILTVSYHENFKLPDGTPFSTQTAFDIASGGQHAINGGLYAHEGYQLFGWNIDKNANAVSTETGWYDAGDNYQFYVSDTAHPENSRDEENLIHYGNLTLYAIWKVNGYYVDFVAGIPEGETWTGDTWTDVYVYNQEKALPENWFVWPGYAFDGWKLPDGTVKQVGEMIKNLTNQNAATETVTATWKVCTHPVCEVTSDGANTLTKTCKVCQYSATAKLTAQDAVYDGARHEAVLECSDENFWKDAGGNLLTVNYVGKTIKPQNAAGNWVPANIASDRLCIGAGEYTASIAGGGVTLNVQYTIAKAEQNAPAERPTYVKPESGTTLLINQITTRNSEQSRAHVQYIVRYVENSNQIDSPVTIPDGEEDPDQLSFNLPESLKVYSVLAYYPETDDYLASNLVSAELSFLFTGNLQLKVDAQDGIDFWMGETGEEGKKELMLFAKLQSEDYYVVGEDFEFKRTVTSTTTTDYDPNNLEITKSKVVPDGYTMAIKAGEEPTQMTEITIYIHGVKKKATATGYAKEKQHFSDFTKNDNPVISRDSAFTVRFNIEDYDALDYQDPVLKFSTTGNHNEVLPAGTTIILRDRADNGYWYVNISSATSTVRLGDFMQMSASGQGYEAQTGDMDLQFVVDFSRCATAVNGKSIICTLSASKQRSESNVPELVSNELPIGLGDASLELDKKVLDNGYGTLTNVIKITSGATGQASKYDHRDLALVVTPKDGTKLPADATIRMSLNGSHTIWRPDSEGNFYISLGEFRSLDTDITLELHSGMFPMHSIDYYLDAALYLAPTDAEIAPLNGTPADVVELKFKSNRERTGIKITVANDKRLLTTLDDIAAIVTVEPQYYELVYNVVVELHQEFNGNTFGDTTIKPQVDESTNTYTFDLAGRPTGDYRIVASLQTKGGYTINEAYYYFIIHPTSESNP